MLTESLVVLGVLNSLLFLALVGYYGYKELSKKITKKISGDVASSVVKSHSKHDFDMDIKFLLFIVEFKVRSTQSTFLEAMSNSNQKTLLTTAVLDEQSETIILSIMEIISEDYRKVLSRYFKDDTALLKFVTEAVYIEVFKFIKSKNETKITNILSR
jgi:hypothetical protein